MPRTFPKFSRNGRGRVDSPNRGGRRGRDNGRRLFSAGTPQGSSDPQGEAQARPPHLPLPLPGLLPAPTVTTAPAPAPTLGQSVVFVPRNQPQRVQSQRPSQSNANPPYNRYRSVRNYQPVSNPQQLPQQVQPQVRAAVVPQPQLQPQFKPQLQPQFQPQLQPQFKAKPQPQVLPQFKAQPQLQPKYQQQPKYQPQPQPAPPQQPPSQQQRQQHTSSPSARIQRYSADEAPNYTNNLPKPPARKRYSSQREANEIQKMPNQNPTLGNQSNGNHYTSSNVSKSRLVPGAEFVPRNAQPYNPQHYVPIDPVAVPMPPVAYGGFNPQISYSNPYPFSGVEAQVPYMPYFAVADGQFTPADEQNEETQSQAQQKPSEKVWLPNPRRPIPITNPQDGSAVSASPPSSPRPTPSTTAIDAPAG